MKSVHKSVRVYQTLIQKCQEQVCRKGKCPMSFPM